MNDYKSRLRIYKKSVNLVDDKIVVETRSGLIEKRPNNEENFSKIKGEVIAQHKLQSNQILKNDMRFKETVWLDILLMTAIIFYKTYNNQNTSLLAWLLLIFADVKIRDEFSDHQCSKSNSLYDYSCSLEKLTYEEWLDGKEMLCPDEVLKKEPLFIKKLQKKFLKR